MKKEKKRLSRGRVLGRGIALLLAVYLAAALLPYAFPPAPSAANVDIMLAGAGAGSGGERAAILETGEEALAGRLYLIENARATLRVSAYLFACDESGMRIGAALLDAADRGVRVQLLVDGLIGGINFSGSPLPYALGAHENIEIRFYNPVNALTPWTLNARLHDKYFIADDACLILGGRNISDEFLTAPGHPQYNDDRDVMIFVDAPGDETAVAQATAYFDELWAAPFVSSRFEKGGNPAQIDALRQEMTALSAEGQRGAAARAAWAEAPDFTVPVERTVLLHNPINPGSKEALLFDGLCRLMEGAETRVWIQSPYFVLSGRMESALAAVAAGPSELRLYTNSMASGNNIMASADYLWQKGRVTGLDAMLYEYQADHSSHTKSLLVDDALSIFGSFNFDMRSAQIDTEVMLAVYSRPLNERLAEKMTIAAALALPVSAQETQVPEDLEPAQMPLGKGAVIYLLSPFLFLVRYLL